MLIYMYISVYVRIIFSLVWSSVNLRKWNGRFAEKKSLVINYIMYTDCLHSFCKSLENLQKIDTCVCVCVCVSASPMIIYRKNMPFTRHNLFDDRRAMRTIKVSGSTVYWMPLYYEFIIA